MREVVVKNQEIFYKAHFLPPVIEILCQSLHILKLNFKTMTNNNKEHLGPCRDYNVLARFCGAVLKTSFVDKFF